MPRTGLTPTRVVAEAAAVADEVGIDHLTLAAVADRCGVALPSLYKHIQGLDGLRRDLAVLGMDQLATALTRAAIGRSGRDALASTAHAYRAFATEHPGLYAATLRAPRAEDHEHTAAAQAVLDVALAVCGSYGIEGPEAVHAIRFHRSALHGFVSQEATGAFGMPDSVETSYQRVIEALHLALSHWTELTPQ